MIVTAEEVSKQFFPGNIRIPQLFDRMENKARSHNFLRTQIRIADALCRDDSISHGVYKEISMRGYEATFSLRTLTGLPVFGIAALRAFYHHIPDRGLGVILYGPHVGISEKGHIGELNRYGIKEASVSCGANCALLKILMGETEIKSEEDPELFRVVGLVMPYKREILESQNPFFDLIETEYDLGLEILVQKVMELQKEEHHKPIMIISGIHIDMPYGEGNRFQIRDIVYLENGKETNTWNYCINKP